MKLINQINKLCVLWQKNTTKMLLMCYIVVISLVFTVQAVAGAVTYAGYKTGKYEEKYLDLNDFEHFGVEQVDDMTMINASDDTQLWYTGNLRNVYVKCNFSYAPGEFIVFYNKTADGVFGTHQMVYAYEKDGWYIFNLPAGTKQIRMDTGIYPSITVSFEEILVNRASFNDIMKFSASQMIWMFVLPAVLFCVLSTGMDVLENIQKKRITQNEKETQKV